jgi:hypothetical protein
MVICDKKPANHDLLNAAQARYLQPWRSHAGASVGLRLELIGWSMTALICLWLPSGTHHLPTH